MVQRKKYYSYIKKVILFAVSLVYLIPIWMVLVNSVKAPVEANEMGISLPKMGIHLENYKQVFIEGGIPQAFFNGLLEATVSVVIIIAAASMAAFIIGRSRAKWVNGVFLLFIMGLIVPVAYIPTYLVLDKLNLLDTYTGIILIFTTYGLPQSIFLYVQFVKTIPSELDEAAILDGCSLFQLYSKIIFPLLKPITATVFILSFVGAWNDVMIPMFFTNGSKWALPLTVYNFYGGYLKSWNLIFADIIITISPLVIIYLLAQRQIVEGMTAGAVKG